MTKWSVTALLHCRNWLCKGYPNPIGRHSGVYPKSYPQTQLSVQLWATACMHLCMPWCSHLNTHLLSLCTYTHELAHLGLHTCTHGIAHMHLYTWTPTHARMDSHTWTRTHVHMDSWTRTHAHMDLHTCMHGLTCFWIVFFRTSSAMCMQNSLIVCCDVSHWSLVHGFEIILFCATDNFDTKPKLWTIQEKRKRVSVDCPF